MNQGHTGAAKKVCALSAAVQYFSAAALEPVLVRFSENDVILKDMVHLTRRWGGGRHLWNAYGEQCGECYMLMTVPLSRDPRRPGEDGDGYSGRIGDLRADYVTEEDKGSPDASAAKNFKSWVSTNTTSPATDHGSSGPEVRATQYKIPKLGRTRKKGWRTHTREQPPDQSSVGVHQQVLLGALRLIATTVETRSPTDE